VGIQGNRKKRPRNRNLSGQYAYDLFPWGLKEWSRKKAQKDVLDECGRRFPAVFCRMIDHQLEKHLDDPVLSLNDDGYINQTSDEDLRKCLGFSWQVKTAPYTEGQARKLLIQRFPLCVWEIIASQHQMAE